MVRWKAGKVTTTFTQHSETCAIQSERFLRKLSFPYTHERVYSCLRMMRLRIRKWNHIFFAFFAVIKGCIFHFLRFTSPAFSDRIKIYAIMGWNPIPV